MNSQNKKDDLLVRIKAIEDQIATSRKDINNNKKALIRFVNGSTFQLLGSDNYASLVGLNTDACVFFDDTV